MEFDFFYKICKIGKMVHTNVCLGSKMTLLGHLGISYSACAAVILAILGLMAMFPW